MLFRHRSTASIRSTLWCRRDRRFFRLIAGSAAVSLLLAVSTAAAEAHIKWFAPYNVPGQPKPFHEMLSAAFWEFAALAMVTLVVIEFIGQTSVGAILLRAMDRPGYGLQERREELIRINVGAFFIAIWAYGGIILTPELKSDSELVSWIQVVIAASMLCRSTLIIGSIGIAALYIIGILDYSIFHLLDYPIFLGFALYLGLTGLGREFIFSQKPIDYLRYAISITLMWASIEKWAYPQWTYPVLKTHAALMLGFGATTYMTAAGVIEFALGFGLLCGALVRRSSALVLVIMFISAIAEFGKIDAIGHLLIIVSLLVILVEKVPLKVRSPFWIAPSYAFLLGIFLCFYYGLHHLIYHTAIM